MYFRKTENIKSREVTGGVFESAPSAPPYSFFQLGQKHTILNFRGGICPPVLKQGVHMHTLPHGCARLCVKDLISDIDLFELHIEQVSGIIYIFTVKRRYVTYCTEAPCKQISCKVHFGKESFWKMCILTKVNLSSVNFANVNFLSDNFERCHFVRDKVR